MGAAPSRPSRQARQPPLLCARQDSRALCLPRTKVREKGFHSRSFLSRRKKVLRPSSLPPGPQGTAGTAVSSPPVLPASPGPLSPPKPAPSGPTGPFPGQGGWFFHRAAPGADRGLTGAQPGFSRPQGILRHRRHPRHREGCRTPPPTGGRCCGGSQSALPGPPSRTATVSSAVSTPWR